MDCALLTDQERLLKGSECCFVSYRLSKSQTLDNDGLLDPSLVTSNYSELNFFLNGNNNHNSQCHTSDFSENMSRHSRHTQTDTCLQMKYYFNCPIAGVEGIPLISAKMHAARNTMTCLSKVGTFSFGKAFRGLARRFRTFLCN